MADKPITRRERALNGEGDSPLTRQEMIIAGKDITPVTRFERFLKKFVDEGGGVTPTGTITITQNGQHNVTQYATANVQVPQGVFPTGTKNITANGTYDVTNFASAEVNTDPAKGFVLDEWDEDGYPTRARFVGNWTSIPANFLGGYTPSGLSQEVYSSLHRITKLTIPDTVTSLGMNFLSSNPSVKELILGTGLTDLSAYYIIRTNRVLEKITYKGNITAIQGYQTFNLKQAIFTGDLAGLTSINGAIIGGAAPVELYDFSATTAPFGLPSTSALPHAAGCVIKIKQSLLASWPNETNWNALTDVVWEGV